MHVGQCNQSCRQNALPKVKTATIFTSTILWWASRIKKIHQWFLVSPEFFNNSTKRKRIWLPVQINQVEYLDNWNGEMWLKVGLFQKKDGHPIAQEFFKGAHYYFLFEKFLSHFYATLSTWYLGFPIGFFLSVRRPQMCPLIYAT